MKIIDKLKILKIKRKIEIEKKDSKFELTNPQLCYGQDGEDLVLDRLLEYQCKGFYIDIGAHHPSRFSNTYLFYLRGWNGINIDAQPNSMLAFNLHRPRDINIECGVGLKKGISKYFQFNESALNTFDEEEAEIKNQHPYKIINIQKIEVNRLEDILDRYLEEFQIIDFLTVDVEGKDLDVLKSNNWIKYRPKYVLAESLRTTLSNIQECPVVQYLNSVDYDLLCKVYNTAFFVKRK